MRGKFPCFSFFFIVHLFNIPFCIFIVIHQYREKVYKIWEEKHRVYAKLSEMVEKNVIQDDLSSWWFLSVIYFLLIWLKSRVSIMSQGTHNNKNKNYIFSQSTWESIGWLPFIIVILCVHFRFCFRFYFVFLQKISQFSVDCTLHVHMVRDIYLWIWQNHKMLFSFYLISCKQCIRHASTTTTTKPPPIHKSINHNHSKLLTTVSLWYYHIMWNNKSVKNMIK